MHERRIAANLVIMGGGQVVTWTLSTCYLVLMSQYMGPARLGEIALAGSIAAMLMLVVRLGMDTLIARAVARAPERSIRLIRAAIVVRALLLLPMFLVLHAYAALTHLNAETTIAAYLVLFASGVSAFGGVFLAGFQGREQMSIGVISQVLRSLNEIVVTLITIALQAGVVFFVAGDIPFEVVLVVLYVRWYARHGRLVGPVTWQDVRATVVESLPFWAGGIFLTIYTYIDSVLLGALAGTRAVGIYAPAVRMFSVGFFLPTIVGAATLPMLSRLGARGGQEFQRASRKTLSLLVICAVPLSIGLCTFSGPLILTVYGPGYRQSVPVLAVLSLCLLPTFLNMQASQTLAANNRQWRWTVALAVSCVLNPAVNAALIPFAEHHWHNGALGAALALLVTELGMAAYSLVQLRSILFTAEMYWSFGGATAAGVAQTATLCFAAGFWPVLAEALGVLAFTLVAVVLGVLPLDDLRLLLRAVYDLVGRRFRRRARRGAADLADAVVPAR